MDIYVSYTCLKITSVFHITLSITIFPYTIGRDVSILKPRIAYKRKVGIGSNV